MTKTYGNLINGEWLLSDQQIDVQNKYTHKSFAKVAIANEDLIEKAIINAHKTFHSRKLSVS